MLIQWFPGHMTKAIRKMEVSLKKVDSIIYLLDSRAPFSCINPVFEKLMENKKTLFVLNKCDLVNPRELALWKAEFINRGMTVVTSNSTSGRDAKEVISALTEINRERIDRNMDKGVNYSVKAMVIGMPNTGKSTLINSLCGNKRAITGNKPGVTRGEQWVRLSNGIILLDTPGTLCPSIEDTNVALNLAFIGCIRDAVLDTEGLALALIKKLTEICKECIIERYGVLVDNMEPLEIYDAIAKSRGFLIKGGEPDYTRTANTVIDDFRKGRLGKIILELPYEKRD